MSRVVAKLCIIFFYENRVRAGIMRNLGSLIEYNHNLKKFLKFRRNQLLRCVVSKTLYFSMGILYGNFIKNKFVQNRPEKLSVA